ncbi:DUF707 domain-containing protein [Gluconacetobacter johannae]|nr:DUF707 domain-containing protein [Gluconacetobacter johannae]
MNNEKYLPSGHLKKRFCIFTSAGDNNNIAKLMEDKESRNWDLVVAFYGNSEIAYRNIAEKSDFTFIIKGAKFQNLKSIVVSQPAILSGYDYIWVVDDDIEFTLGNASILFDVASFFDFDVSQPAFSSNGKISHEITRMVEKEKLVARIVNFIEVTCPLFKAEALFDFLNIYDGKMAGWGVDWWFCNYLGSNKKAKFAIFDKIVVKNMHDSEKTPDGKREISQYMSDNDRIMQWEILKNNFHYKEFDHTVFFELSLP